MPQHRVRYRSDQRVLHWGLITDRQLPWAASLALLSMLMLALGGSFVTRLALALAVIFPVAVMILDNHSGGLLQARVRAELDYRRSPGTYDPGSPGDPPGYILLDPAGGERQPPLNHD